MAKFSDAETMPSNDMSFINTEFNDVPCAYFTAFTHNANHNASLSESPADPYWHSYTHDQLATVANSASRKVSASQEHSPPSSSETLSTTSGQSTEASSPPSSLDSLSKGPDVNLKRSPEPIERPAKRLKTVASIPENNYDPGSKHSKKGNCLAMREYVAYAVTNSSHAKRELAHLEYLISQPIAQGSLHLAPSNFLDATLVPSPYIDRLVQRTMGLLYGIQSGDKTHCIEQLQQMALHSATMYFDKELQSVFRHEINPRPFLNHHLFGFDRSLPFSRRERALANAILSTDELIDALLTYCPTLTMDAIRDLLARFHCYALSELRRVRSEVRDHYERDLAHLCYQARKYRDRIQIITAQTRTSTQNGFNTEPAGIKLLTLSINHVHNCLGLNNSIKYHQTRSIYLSRLEGYWKLFGEDDIAMFTAARHLWSFVNGREPKLEEDDEPKFTFGVGEGWWPIEQSVPVPPQQPLPQQQAASVVPPATQQHPVSLTQPTPQHQAAPQIQALTPTQGPLPMQPALPLHLAPPQNSDIWAHSAFYVCSNGGDTYINQQELLQAVLNGSGSSSHQSGTVRQQEVFEWAIPHRYGSSRQQPRSPHQQPVHESPPQQHPPQINPQQTSAAQPYQYPAQSASHWPFLQSDEAPQFQSEWENQKELCLGYRPRVYCGEGMEGMVD